MASPEWLEIFRSYAPDELAAHVGTLKRQISVFTQQAVGSKSYVKDLRELKEQLSAAVRVQKERAQPGNPAVGITDFSRLTT